MKKCTSCGATLEDDFKVCPYCGVNAENAPAVPQNNAQNTHIGSDGSFYRSPAYGQQRPPYYGAGANVFIPPSIPMNVIGLIGMIFSILADILFWIPVFNILVALTGVILSGIGYKRRERYRLNGFAFAGLIIGIISILVGFIWTILFLG